MIEGPYESHDASRENGGTPTFNVKGPSIDRLVSHMYTQRAKHSAEALAEDLNIAYRQGFEAAKKETP